MCRILYMEEMKLNYRKNFSEKNIIPLRMAYSIKNLITYGVIVFLLIGIGSCRNTQNLDAPEEALSKVMRNWDEGLDDDWYELDEDRKFKVEYPNGGSFLFGVNEDEVSVTLYGGNPNGTETLVIPSQVDHADKIYKVTQIGRLAFATMNTDSIRWMESVKNIIVSEGIEGLGSKCFEGAPDLRVIALPKSLKSIGFRSLADCNKLKKVDIPMDAKLWIINDCAFMNCNSLTEFVLNDSIRHIRPGAWNNCKGLSSFKLTDRNKYFEVVDGVLYTGSRQWLIQYPTGKKDPEYSIAPNTQNIRKWAFYGNEHIKHLNFPESLSTVEEWAFYGCPKLKNVAFNDSLKSIGKCAFDECTSLKEVKLNGSTLYVDEEDWWNNSFPKWTKVRRCYQFKRVE